MMKSSREPEFFNKLYARNADPWDFETSAYEANKYDATLAVLGDDHFASVFEAGCSIGVLTSRLAARCDALLAVDVADAALASARARCAGLPQLSFERRVLPGEWPEGLRFDLIVLSEILYFLSPDDIRGMAARAVDALSPGGRILLVNFTPPIDEPCSGDEATVIFMEACPLPVQAAVWAERYRLELLGQSPT